MRKLNCALALMWVTALNANAQVLNARIDTLNEIVVERSLMDREFRIGKDIIRPDDASSSRTSPYSVSTVSQKQIESTGRTQLLSALNTRIPGLFVTERNIFGFGVSTGGSGGIKLRGVGGEPTNQVLMMVDGKPQFAAVFSHHIADNYESEYVERVEVVRGPSSVLYGSNAMGGAINVITKTPHEDGVKTTLQSQYGSYNTWQSSVTNMVRKGRFSSIVSAGYDRTDGTQKDFDFWQASAYAKVSYKLSNAWGVHADYNFMKFKGNDPIYAKLEKGTDDIYHQDVLRGEASMAVSNKYHKTYGAMRVYYNHGNNKIDDPKPFQMFDNRFGILAYQNYQPTRATHLIFGFDFDHYTGKVPLSGGMTHEEAVAKNMPTTMSRKAITEYSPYLTLSQVVIHNVLLFNAGIRMANSNLFGTQWVPQAGITLNPGAQWTLKANLSKGYRNPSFKELYLYKMANADLDPENMMNYEVSLGKSFSDYLSLEFTGFISKGSNIIQSVFDDELKHPLNVNTGEFTNKGIEFAASSHPLQNLNLRATYSLLHTDITNLTGAPKHQYSVGADWTVTPKLTLNADVVGVSRLYVASSVKKQNYALLNLRASYNVHKMLNLFVQGNNLTNARYCINKGYEMPGATISGGFKLKM